MSGVPARHPISNVFLLHIALELPLAISGIFDPLSMPLLQMSNTTVLILKLYGVLALAVCVMAGLVMNLPEFLPGKRAIVIGLTTYHGAIASMLLRAERIIPISFGPTFESLSITPEATLGGLHALLCVLFLVWWQVTLPIAQSARQGGQVPH